MLHVLLTKLQQMDTVQLTNKYIDPRQKLILAYDKTQNQPVICHNKEFQHRRIFADFSPYNGQKGGERDFCGKEEVTERKSQMRWKEDKKWPSPRLIQKCYENTRGDTVHQSQLCFKAKTYKQIC